MKSFLFALLPFALYFIHACMGHNCVIKKELSGVISESLKRTALKCWTIEVPKYMYIELDKQLNLSDSVTCSDVYMKVTITKKNETYTYCEGDRSYRIPLIASSDVTINLSHRKFYSEDSSSFILEYRTEHPVCSRKNHFRCSNITCIDGSQVCNGVKECDDGSDEIECENLICKQKNNFRCSTRTCINDSKVCDGVKDCENGSDEIGCEKGVLAVKGVNASRENTRAWLLKNRQSDGWGRNTHRAITALFLAQVASFRGQNLEEELMVKQLELQTLLTLLRNSTDPLSVSELSMFINALSVACHDPRRFYGYDLVKILGERVSIATSQSPGVYLTLCNSNWTLRQSDIRSLLHLLHRHSTYPFTLDVQALTLMALTCVKNLQEKDFTVFHYASNIYNVTVEKFITGQLSDGSFGNVYTTALITQALIASGQENNPKWNVTSTVQYLMKQLNSSSVDFLSAYLALPIFSGRSLVDIAAVNCTDISRKQDEDNEISDLTNKLGGKIRVQYSLYVGDQRDVLHTIYLRLPKKSSAYDIMMIAQVAEPEYKFRHKDVSGHMYVYEIADIINDPEAEKFWLMYSENSNRTVERHIESPDKFIVDDGEHLIMWYKTAHI